MVSLSLYQGEEEKALELIKAFWGAHNQVSQSDEEARRDLLAWTSPGNRFYFIIHGGRTVGFLHLGSRGADPDWLEDIFVLPDWQGRGIGSRVVGLAEAIVREYSPCIYVEAAARNEAAIRLYRKLGFDCLNTVTLRKDFESFSETKGKEKLFGLDFEIKDK